MPPTEPITQGPPTSPSLPPGFVAAPLPETAGAPLKLCAIVRKTPDAVAGHFVILRTLLDAIVYLGCITDVGGRLHGYIEIWVQNLEGLASSPAAAREALTNRILDERWAKLFKACENLDENGSDSRLYRTGFETTPAKPILLDPVKGELLHPATAAGTQWKLCTDDAKLAAKSLPAYSSSLHRYLAADDHAPLIPVTHDAPVPQGTAPLKDILGPGATLLPFSLGGLLLVRRYSPVALEAYFDLLSGGSWEGILTGRTAVHLDKLNESLEEKDGSPGDLADGRLFLGKHGKWGRLTETFHLKLRLLADCLAEVRTMTAQTQRPMLSLSTRSFQVSMGNGGSSRALPFLWTAAAHLVDPGDAVTLKLEGSDALYFLRGLSAEGNVYQPESVSKPAAGRGVLRIRKTMAEQVGVILEGTFTTHDRLGSGAGGTSAEPTRNDLLWLRVPVGSQRVDLFGHIEKEPALAAGEWRFRTERQRLPEATVAQLKSAEGVPIPETMFDVIPLLSSPCDMYSLAILGARALLVSADNTLAIAADELTSLARQVSQEAQADKPLGERIQKIFQDDPRWLKSLGPQRLTREALTPEEAFDLVPAALWFDTLALLVRMLPGVGPDSVCCDYGDAPRGGIHKIYEPIQAALDTLLVRTRSLIVIDWRFNREIHAVLRRFATSGTSGKK